MKKNGLSIAGGILEIIAGGLWLCIFIMVNNLLIVDGSIKFEQLIMPLCIIFFGVLAMTPKATKSTLIAIGILNFFCIGLQIFFEYYFGLGIFQIVLLFTASILFFCAINNKQKYS